MIAPTSVSPTVHLCPIGAARDDQQIDLSTGDGDEIVDGKLAVAKDPIVGVERVVYDDATGSGALPAKLSVSPRGMSASQRASPSFVNDLAPGQRRALNHPVGDVGP